MRRSLVVLLPLAILALIVFVVQAEEGAAPKWLDPQNCYFCKPLAETEGLLDHVGWETHKIANGIVTVTTYGDEWKDKMKAASAAMEKLWTEYDPSKEVHMCGLCRAWTQMPMDKIKMESVEFKGGELGLSTSDDPAIVAQLHEIADKTCNAMDEMKKMQPPAEKQ
jgi:hypothetical protein